MPLRPDLLYHHPTPERIAELRALLTAVESAPSGSPEAATAMRAFNSRAAREYAPPEFAYHGACTTDTFLAKAATPTPLPVPHITDEELVDIVVHILHAPSEAEQAYYIGLFDAQFVMPHASLLLYYPPKRLGIAEHAWDPTPEQVIALAREYQPIQL